MIWSPFCKGKNLTVWNRLFVFTCYFPNIACSVLQVPPRPWVFSCIPFPHNNVLLYWRGLQSKIKDIFPKSLRILWWGSNFIFHFSLSFESLGSVVVMTPWKHTYSVHLWVRCSAYHVVPAPPACWSLTCLSSPSSFSVGRKMWLVEAEMMMYVTSLPPWINCFNDPSR